MPLRYGRRSSLVLGVALVVGIVAGLALWPRDAPPDAVPAPAAERPTAGSGRNDVAPARATPRDAQAPFDAREGPPDSGLPFRLRATVVRENPALSIATLEGEGGGGHQVLAEGDALAGHPRVSVARIERARILLDNEGVREQLRIDWGERPPADGVAAAAPEPGDRLGGRPAPAPPEPPVPQRAGTPAVEAPAVGELRGVYRDGELVGVSVDAVRPGGLYERFGLEEGDVLTSVNGVALDGPDAAVQLLRELTVAEQLEVAVEREDGSEALLSLSTDDLAEALRQLE